VIASVSDIRNWADRALCGKLADADYWFFGLDGESPEAQSAREAEAVKVCDRCPVRLRCALWALRTDAEHGVFGGLTPQNRADMKRDGTRKAVAA
jgi:WhiB family transcriptional regulator, redox-sensing transcriptional regulator